MVNVVKRYQYEYKIYKSKEPFSKNKQTKNAFIILLLQ